MNQKSDEMQGPIILFAFVAAGMIFLLKIVIALAFLIACGLSLLCLMALRKPYSVFQMTITPQEAKAFFVGGMVGIVAFKAIGMVVVGELEFQRMPELLKYLNMAGYAVGAFVGSGIAGYIEQTKAPPYLPAPAAAVVPAPVTPPPMSNECQDCPFVFATWDDEERLG